MSNPVKASTKKTAKPRVTIIEEAAHQYLPDEQTIIETGVRDQSVYKEKTRAEIALNSISDAVFCTDENDNVDYLNIAAEKLTGWSREEANGRPSQLIFNIIDGTTRQPAYNPVALVLQSNKANGLAADTILIKRDGSEVIIEDSASQFAMRTAI